MCASPVLLTFLPYCLPNGEHGERERTEPSQERIKLKYQLLKLNKGTRRGGALQKLSHL